LEEELIDKLADKGEIESDKDQSNGNHEYKNTPGEEEQEDDAFYDAADEPLAPLPRPLQELTTSLSFSVQSKSSSYPRRMRPERYCLTTRYVIYST